MNQVIGHLDSLQRTIEPFPHQGIASHDVEVLGIHAALEGLAGALGVAPEGSHALSAGEQPGDEQGADEAARAGDECCHPGDDDVRRDPAARTIGARSVDRRASG